MNFSVFERPNYKKPSGAVSLASFASIVSDPALGGSIFIEASCLVNEIRNCADPVIQKQLKQKLPAIAPGVRFGLNRQDIRSYTGLMQIDIDKGITDPEKLRNDLGTLSWVVFSALSVRRGVWFLARIPEPHKQHIYWERINDWLYKNYKLNADPARKNAKDLRFFAPDPGCIFNPNAILLPAIPPSINDDFGKIRNPKKHDPAGSGYLSPITDFNQRADVVEMLLRDGWKISHTHGVKVRLTRPGKQNGTSADWHTEKRRLYIFTDNSNLYQSSLKHGLSATDVLMQLNQIQTLSEARTVLKEMGYGKDRTAV